MSSADTPALREVAASGVRYRVTDYGPVTDLEEAARKRGVPVHKVIKSLVVRTGEDAYVMVLVPGDRVIDWPKLRDLLGVSRMSLAPTDEAQQVTGYDRGAITPFGSRRAMPVILDASVRGEISVGSGAHGMSIHLEANDLVALTAATIADVTKRMGAE